MKASALLLSFLLWHSSWAKWCGDAELRDPDTGFLHLARIPSDCSWLTLGGRGISRKNLDNFQEALQTHENLSHLEMGSNLLGDDGALELAAGLMEGGRNLTWLSLHSNGIGDAGAEALAGALARHPTLRTLSLWENDIGDAGVAALAAALAGNQALEELSLALNPRVGDAGLASLAEALAADNALRSLWLWGLPQITRAGAEALAGALGHNGGHARIYLVHDGDDAHPLCATWAEVGECARNPTYMLDACASSCDDGGTYADAPEEAGPRGGGGGGEQTAGRRHTDGHPECRAWAMQEAGCSQHRQFMRSACPRSCALAEAGHNTHPSADGARAAGRWEL